MNWNWYPHVLRNRYAQFEGRAQREEFWMFVLVSFLVNLGLELAGGIVPLLHLLLPLYNLAVLLPSLALGARRLHDTGRSGWWQLVALVPFVGVIALIVLFVQDGETGGNAYGDDPRTLPAAPSAARS